jgi:iron complex outermembrane receptor protein
MPLLSTLIDPLYVERLFGHLEWRAADNLLANVGAMVENNSLSGTDVAPQVALNWSFDANQTIRFNLSRALRTPTVIENQGKFAVGPPGSPRYGPAGDLLPETILSREVSYVAQWPEQHATLDLKLFDDDVNQLIDLIGMRNDSAAQAFPKNAVNGDAARERGIEGQYVWRPSADTMLLASAAYLHIASGDLLDNYSTSAPRTSAHLLVSHRFADTWDASVNVQQQSGFRAAGYSEPQRAFCRVDARIARQFQFAGGETEIALATQNLFDSHYTEYRHDDVAERVFWLTFAVRLQR